MKQLEMPVHSTDYEGLPKKNPQREVADWNNRVQIGDLVEYRSYLPDGPVSQHRTRTRAEVLSGHTAVVWLEGKAGCVAVSHCRKI